MNPDDFLSLPLERKRALVAALSAGRNGHHRPGTNGAGPVAPAKDAVAARPAGHGKKALEFSLLFFSNDASGQAGDKYQLVRECAKFADEHGFKAVWVPERHFHSFGGIYPSPAVLCASLASLTKNVRLRAGSVVLPLEDPLRVAEAWAMVDNLSGGRVDISFAPGWNPNDFVLSPGTYRDNRDVLARRVAQVRKLWRGESLRLQNGKGDWVETQVFPRPIQPELPFWWTAAGNPATFQQAGQLGANVLTMLFSSSLEELGGKLALYRQARIEAGHAAADGIVTLMLHTFVGRDLDYVRQKVRDPFLAYIRQSIDVQRHGQTEKWSEAELDRMAGFAYERYFRTGALFGSPATCQDLLQKALATGVNEIACQLDFGIDNAAVLESLVHLKELKEAHELSLGAVSVRHPGLPAVNAVVAPISRPATRPANAPAGAVAIIGLAGRFPQSATLDEFWANLAAGRDLTSDTPADRRAGREPPASCRRGGFLADADGLDADFFGIPAREAAAMDPHQRVFLETAWATLEDAGYPPGQLGEAKVGLFVGMYSPDFGHLLGPSQDRGDSAGLTGRLNVMVANRVSHLLDLRGPSELVDTACSSSLVAIHRGIQAIAAGDCDLALAGGVSLLLSPASSEWLGQVELLSADGKCRPFDQQANGLVRGEGAGAVLLKPLALALADGDTIHAVVRGSAVNHNGRGGGALTTPHPTAQADLVAEALRKGGIDPASVNFIEAHGGASPLGDLVEVTAFKRAFSQLAPSLGHASCGIGSLKPNIGALDAAGGIAGVIKVILAMKHRQWPATLNQTEPRADLELEQSPFYLTTKTKPWVTRLGDPHPGARRAAVHAYGLGGVNAHVILEEGPAGRALSPGEAEDDQIFVFSARDPGRLREIATRFRRWLSQPFAPLADAAFTLREGRTAFPHRLAIVAGSQDELRVKLDVFLQGTLASGSWQGMIPAGNPAGFTSVALEGKAWAEAWVHGRTDSPLPSRGDTKGRRVSLPGYPFARRRFRLPVPVTGPLGHPLLETFQPRPGGAGFTKAFYPGDGLVDDHRFRGAPLVPAAVFCEMARAAAANLALGPVTALESVTFLRPLEVVAPGVSLGLELTVDDRRGSFELAAGAGGNSRVYARGRFCCDASVRSAPTERLDLGEISARCPVETSRDQLYARFDRLGIDYGPSFRNLEGARSNDREALGKISLAPGLEAELKTQLLHPAALDALLQLGVVFGWQEEAIARLPLSIEALELVGPLPADGMAYLQRIEGPATDGVCRFHGAITDAVGRIVLKIRDLCLKEVAAVKRLDLAGIAPVMRAPRHERTGAGVVGPGIATAASVLAQLAAGTLTVDEADAWFAGRTAVRPLLEALGAELGRRSPGAAFGFTYRTGRSEAEPSFTLMIQQGTCVVEQGSGEPGEGVLTVSPENLSRLMAGEVEPTELFLQGGVGLEPASALALRQRIGAVWFARFNRQHLPGRFRDHLLGQIYEAGEVQAGPGLRREIFPWALSADAGAILYRLVTQEKPRRTLEIGMAYGLSSLFVCQALRDNGEGGEHVAVDPCQLGEFLSIGLDNVRAAGLESHLRFLGEPDYLALPALAREGLEVQFVFIDGLHLFDYTLLDFFYCDRLLAKGGYLVFDDCLAPGVAQAVDYVRSNRDYEPCDLGCVRLAGFRKRGPDSRSLEDPNFHREF